MPPRLNLWSACRTLAVRSRPAAAQWQQRQQQQQPRIIAALARGFADDAASKSTASPSPNHNSNALTSSVPDSADGSTMPLSMLSAGRLAEARPAEAQAPGNGEALRQLELMAQGLDPFDPAVEGHRFGLPERRLPPSMHLKDRYDPVLTQITKLLMRDGKLSKAQRDMSMILNYLRTSPVPKINPARPLLPGAPPPSHLPLNPVLYLTLAIDSVAPLVKVRSFAGLAGGGTALPVPTPLKLRQRRRQAFMWILDVVNKKPSKGSGRTMFAHRVAEELVAVIEGRSSVWDKRQIVHKLGTSARANLNHLALRRK